MQGRREEETVDVYGAYVEDFRQPRTQPLAPAYGPDPVEGQMGPY